MLPKTLAQRVNFRPASPETPGQDMARVAVLLETLVSELHAAALDAAIVGTAANALLDPGTHMSPETITPFTTRDLAVLSVLRTHLLWLKSDEFMLVHEFLASLAEGHGHLASYFAESATLGPMRAALLYHRSLSESWRGVARIASLAVCEIGASHHHELPAIHGQNAQVLLDLLESVEQGGRPCLDWHGRLFRPEMPQKRHAPRRMLCQPCRLICRNRVWKAFARDVSTGGMGLDRAPKLALDELVTVELESQRRLAAVVVASEDGYAGLKFTSPLSPLDPLISG